jgi:hypothetical protein
MAWPAPAPPTASDVRPIKVRNIATHSTKRRMPSAALVESRMRQLGSGVRSLAARRKSPMVPPGFSFTR